MLRERPFDIYTGQEDVLVLVIFFIFFSRHNPVFLFLCNTLLISQVSYRFLALGCFPANLVSDEKEQKNRR